MSGDCESSRAYSATSCLPPVDAKSRCRNALAENRHKNSQVRDRSASVSRLPKAEKVVPRSISASSLRKEAEGTSKPTTAEKVATVSPDVVLFLDVDGVLHPSHCRHPRQQFKVECLRMVKEVLDATGAQIVLSTAWRLDPHARRIVNEKLVQHDMPSSVGRTPTIDMFHRSREIFAWVQKHRPVSWVAVDDWPLHEESKDISGHFVQTRPRFGLQRETADRILCLFEAQKSSILNSGIL